MKSSNFKISSRTKKIIIFSTCYIVAARCLTFYVLSLGADLTIDMNDLVTDSTNAALEASTEVDSIRI